MNNYYDPRSDQDWYYSPENNTQTTTASIGPAIKSLLVVGGLNLVGAAATRYLGGQIKNTIKSWSTQSGNSLRKSIATKALSYNNRLSQKIQPFKNAYERTSIYQAGRERKASLDKIKGRPGYGVTRLTSAFKNPSTFLATSIGVWKRNVWSGMGVAYGIDSMLGITQDLGLERKNWYDVPGQISNFGKWLGVSTIFGMAMGGAGPAIKAMGSAGLMAANKAFGGRVGKGLLTSLGPLSPGVPRDLKYTQSKSESGAHYPAMFNESVISDLRSQEQRKFAAEGIKKGFHFASNLGDAWRHVTAGLYTVPDAVKEAWKAPNLTFGARTRKAFGTIESSLRNVKDILNRPREKLASTVTHPGLAAMDALQALSKDTNNKISFGANDFTSFFAHVKKQSDQDSFTGRVFGFLKPLRNKDIASRAWIKETYGRLQSKFGDGDNAKLLMRNVLNMRVGQNLYKDWRGSNTKGAGVDLSAFDPLYVMRRAASHIANKRFTVPLTKMSMSLGDLTGLNSYLSEKPSFLFFDDKPNFIYRDGLSISDLGQAKDSQFFYYKGKWAVVDGTSAQVVNSNYNLRYTHKSSKDKSFELKTIGINNIKRALLGDPNQGAARYNQLVEKVDYYDAPKNWFLNFLDRRNIGFPEKIQDIFRTLTDKYQDKNTYKQYVDDFFKAPSVENARALPIIGDMYEKTSQVFSRILQNKSALQQIAHYVHNKELKEDFLGIAFSDQKLIDILDISDFKADKWRYNTGFNRAVKDIRAYPQKAKGHHSVRRLGPFSEMTSFDIVRKDMIEDIFNRDMIGGPAGTPHPLIEASKTLLEKRIITEKEYKYLNLHAKLSIFRDEGLIRNTPENFWPDVVRRVQDRAKDKNWDYLKEITDFISNEDIKRPSINFLEKSVIPREWGELKNANLYPKDINPYVSVPQGGINVFKDIITKSMDSVTSMMSEYLPYRKRYISHHGFEGNLKYLGGFVGTTAAVFGAYRIMDIVTAANPLFDNTMLDDGITGAGADVLAKVRFGISRVADVTGYTSTMKYLHGLAPMSETTIPGAIVGGIVGLASKTGPLGVAKGFLGGAILNRLASPYLPDMTKTHEELREIYSGREMVPVMKAPTWLLGGTPWEGSKVAAYSPNWYVRAKSRWKESDTMYGSSFRRLLHEPLPLLGFNVGDILDPYYMERKHYFTRPYPITGGAFDEVPILGGALNATIGRIIKPQKTMHQEFLQREMITSDDPGNPYPFVVRPPTLGEGMGMMKNRSRVRSLGGTTSDGGTINITPRHWGETVGEDLLYDVQNFAGLKGFLSSVVTDRIFGKNRVIPTLETAGRIASFSRSYTDLNLGGMGPVTEPLRRIIEKPLYRQYGVNPIPNMMPNWLPSEFLTGDPYEKILRGELRLPGEAYLSTHANVRRTMPARASMIGASLENATQYFVGLLPPLLQEEYNVLESGTEFHEAIQNNLAAEGLLLQAEALVQDVKNDITGHVDAIIRDGTGGRGRRALEIKTINNEGFQKLDAPKDQHVGQLNFYLKQLHLKRGTFLYVNRDNPSQVKTFEINYSQSRWEQDLAKLKKARSIAATMMQEGVSDTLGYSYSWVDRLSILADVSPNSQEYKEAKTIVEQQIKFGILTDTEISKYKNALKMKQARIRKYELYPKRFKGKLLSPDTNKNIQSINEDIKAGADYTLPERAIGWMWETFTNTNNAIINKLWAAKDPLEHYKMTRIYGKEYKPWDEPIRSWAKPWAATLAAKTSPIEGGVSYGAAGYLIGGPLGGVLGGAYGTMYGTVHGLYRAMTGTTYIPGDVQEKREIVSYFDAAKYERNNMLASLSQGISQKQFLKQRDATLTAFNQGQGATVANLFRGTSTFEKPYIESFLNTRNPEERENILKYVPEDLGAALRSQWSRTDNYDATKKYVNQSSRDLSAGSPRYAFDRSVLDPNVPLEDIELKTINERGFDQFEFGLGWNEQMLRIQDSNQKIKAAQIERINQPREDLGYNLNSANIRGIINNLFSKDNIRSFTKVYVDVNQDNFNYIDVIIKRDRSQTITNALNNRKKFGLNNE